MCTRVCVCAQGHVHVRGCVHLCLRMCLCVYMCTRVSVSLYVYACFYVCVLVYVYVCVFQCVSLSLRSYMSLSQCVCERDTYTYRDTHIHTLRGRHPH